MSAGSDTPSFLKGLKVRDTVTRSQPFRVPTGPYSIWARQARAQASGIRLSGNLSSPRREGAPWMLKDPFY